MERSESPQIALTKTAASSSSIRTGITKVIAKINFDMNVERVDSHISLDVCLFSASSEMCMPSASESASAIAIVSMPPMTAILE